MRRMIWCVIFRDVRNEDDINDGYGLEFIVEGSSREEYEKSGYDSGRDDCWKELWRSFDRYVNRFGGFDDIVKVEISIGNGIRIVGICEWVVLYKEIIVDE